VPSCDPCRKCRRKGISANLSARHAEVLARSDRIETRDRIRKHPPGPDARLPCCEILRSASAKWRTPRAACCALLQGTVWAAASTCHASLRLEIQTRPSADDVPKPEKESARAPRRVY